MIAAAMPAALPPARADAMTINYVVTRNGNPIGTTTVNLMHDGRQSVVEVATHVQVKIAFITVYRFEQREIERWAGGKLLAMNAVTDDNGAVHRVSVSAAKPGAALSVEADGRRSSADPAVIPAMLWNAALVAQTQALDPQSGEVRPISVVDRGEEQLVLHGQATLAHHYSITTDFAQDVWYDRQNRLVKVELHGSDGSNIQYHLG